MRLPPACVFAVLYAGVHGVALAQTAAPPDPVWSGSVGAGLAITSGNTETKNFNLSFGLTYDPKDRHLFKVTGLYLHGEKSGSTNLDRRSLVARDEYSLGDRTFAFGQVEYLRDRFKEIDFLMSPTAGIGYELFDREPCRMSIDGGIGVLWERNPRRETDFTGTPSIGERLSWKISPAATLTHSFSSLWKTADLGDSLSTATLGVAVSITRRLQIKTEIIDSYKSRPPRPEVKKNDLSFLTTLVVKFP